MTAELVGPLPTIRFHDGAKQAYDVPRDTMDPRYVACASHRPACDCREAERSEEIAELRGNLKMAADDLERQADGVRPDWPLVVSDG